MTVWKKDTTEEGFPERIWYTDEEFYKDLFDKNEGKLTFYREPNGSITVITQGERELFMEPMHEDYELFDEWMNE